MKTQSLKSVLFITLALLVQSGRAQGEANGVPPERMKEIKAQKSAFITQRLSLTPEEARTFWPVYDRFDSEVDAIRKGQRTNRKERLNGAALTEEEAAKAIASDLQVKQDQLNLRKRYVEEFKKAIGAVKTLQLEDAERDFNRELLKRFKARNDGGGSR